MKRIVLAIVLTHLLSTLSHAQSKKFTFTLGEEYGLPRKSSDLAFLGNDRDGILNLSMKKEELTIVRFDTKTLKTTSERAIQLPEATKNFVSETFLDFGSTYYWLHSDWDKDSETETLYYDVIDVAAGKLKATNKKMFQTTKLGGEGYASNGFYSAKLIGKYNFNQDADHTKLMVSYRLKPEFRNDKVNYDKLGFQVFDDKMNKLWGGEFTMPYTEAVMDNSDYTVDNNGNAYLLAKVYDSEKRKEVDKETGLPGYHFEVFKFMKGQKKPSIVKVSIGENFLKEVSLVENSLHEIVIACTYSKKAKSLGTDGIYLAAVDENGKLAKYKNGYYEFPLAELQKFESARQRRKMEKKDDYEAPNLHVRDIVVDANGGVFITCEEYYVIVNTYYTTNGGTRTTYNYYYQDIIAAKINPAGDFDWVRKIPKRQRGTSGRGTMSFKLIADASGYYFLYLDNLKNLDIAEDEEPKYHVDGMGGQVIVSKIDMSGVLSKELLFDVRKEDIRIYPADFDKINNNQFIGRARVKKDLFQPLLIVVN